MRPISILPVLCLFAILAGCGDGGGTKPAASGPAAPAPSTDGTAAKPSKITLGLVAKSNSNQVFQVARTAAIQTAKELSAKEGVAISIEWRTPDQESSTEQARNIESLASICQGISVSCSEGEKLAGPIDLAVAAGVAVMTFDSDSPRSKRMCYFGTDDAEMGRRLVGELIKVMGEKGVVAMLAGNQNAPNLQKRVAACREALKKYPGIKLAGATEGAFYHEENGPAAAAAWGSAQNANPEITGWVLVGGWPLFVQGATKPLGEPGKVKVVSCDALPQMLPYVRDGSVQVLLAQDLYGWGKQTVTLLTDKILHGKQPQPFIFGELTAVTKENVEEYAKNWDVWAPKGQ